MLGKVFRCAGSHFFLQVIGADQISSSMVASSEGVGETPPTRRSARIQSIQANNHSSKDDEVSDDDDFQPRKTRKKEAPPSKGTFRPCLPRHHCPGAHMFGRRAVILHDT